jgi:hypothetical protein
MRTPVSGSTVSRIGTVASEDRPMTTRVTQCAPLCIPSIYTSGHSFMGLASADSVAAWTTRRRVMLDMVGKRHDRWLCRRRRLYVRRGAAYTQSKAQSRGHGRGQENPLAVDGMSLPVGAAPAPPKAQRIHQAKWVLWCLPSNSSELD